MIWIDMAQIVAGAKILQRRSTARRDTFSRNRSHSDRSRYALRFPFRGRSLFKQSGGDTNVAGHRALLVPREKLD